MAFQGAAEIIVRHDHSSRRKHVVSQAVTYRLDGLHQKQIILFHQVPPGPDKSRSHLFRVINAEMILEDVQPGKVSSYFCVSNIVWDSGKLVAHQSLRVHLLAKITEFLYASLGIVRTATSVEALKAV